MPSVCTIPVEKTVRPLSLSITRADGSRGDLRDEILGPIVAREKNVLVTPNIFRSELKFLLFKS